MSCREVGNYIILGGQGVMCRGGGHSGVIPVLLQSYCKSYVVNAAISRDFEIRIQTVFQPAKTVKFNPSRFDLTYDQQTWFLLTWKIQSC